MSVVQEQTVLSKIRERGHWRVVIRPITFRKDRVEYAELFRIVEQNAVRLHTWDYPVVERDQETLKGADWIEQDIEEQEQLQVWRLYQSGQFVHYFPLVAEGRELSPFYHPDPELAPGRRAYFLNTIDSLLEIFEFAARLSMTPAGDVEMFVETTMEGLQNRRLVTLSTYNPDDRIFTIGQPAWNYPWQGSRTELIARPRDLAALATRDFFSRFDLDLSVETIRSLQDRRGR
ncbi:MAG: hypothetical protein ACLP7Q_21300 [Isosphaeraceae bacterium]